MDNFVKLALNNSGIIKPLLIPTQMMDGPSLTNPSVLVINNAIITNIRNVNYTLYHAELNKFEHRWGPLSYIHPEHDAHLRTTNYISVLNTNLDPVLTHRVDTSAFDQEPLWEFVGLEDARLIYWENKIYLCGVRRDTTTNGQGRMELSEINIGNETTKEVSRFRIPSPNEEEYCNKNWMPILSKPYEFIKWCNPLEIVKTDIAEKNCKTILNHTNRIPDYNDWRGSSQVVEWQGYYIAIVHETDLYRSEVGNKDATYRHRFLVWDKNWNLIKISKLFSFMDTKIEFCCGMTLYQDYFLITFGIQDNAAYILAAPQYFIERFLNA